MRKRANELVSSLKQLKREQTGLSAELEELKATKAELGERLVSVPPFLLESCEFFGHKYQAGM